MNDEKLDNHMLQLQSPQLDEGVIEQIYQRSRYAFRNEGQLSVREQQYSWFGWTILRWTMLAGVPALVLFMLLFSQPQPNQNDLWEKTLARSEHILREHLAVFPNELQAVITNGGDPRVVLIENHTRISTQPIVIEFRRRGHATRVLTFSGEVISVPLGEDNVKIEVLITGDNQVIVTGDDFLWMGENKSRTFDYQIKAKALGV